MVRGSDGLLRGEIEGREIILDPFAELIWDLSNGARTVQSLALAAGQACGRAVSAEEVFSALDFLADAGLIEQRVAPPAAEASVSRRTLLVRLAPVVGAAMFSSISVRGEGLVQSGESSGKESSDKYRESSNKELSNKESTSKESYGKDYKEQNSKMESINRGRLSQPVKDFDAKEVEGKNEAFEQKIRKSWPQVYEIVGHKLSELQELLEVWRAATRSNPTLTKTNFHTLYLQSQRSFRKRLAKSASAKALLIHAGFEVTNNDFFYDFGPVLHGDKRKRTAVIFRYIEDPFKGDNWHSALSADNLRFVFLNTEWAYEFLSAGQAAETQKR